MSVAVRTDAALADENEGVLGVTAADLAPGCVPGLPPAAAAGGLPTGLRRGVLRTRWVMIFFSSFMRWL